MEEYEFENGFVERKGYCCSGDSTQLSISLSPWKPKCHLNLPRRIFGLIFFLSLVFPSEQGKKSSINKASKIMEWNFEYAWLVYNLKDT